VGQVAPGVAEALWHDFDAREDVLRRVIAERLADSLPPCPDDHIVGSYFFALRTAKLSGTAKTVAYLATSGEKDPPPGSLIEACTAQAAGVDAFDATERMGIVHIAFPLKMLRQADGHVTSTDILHTVAAAGIFDLYEHQDVRLLKLQMPLEVLQTFPGPAYGPQGIRAATGFGSAEPAFGTILKPTAGITPEDVELLVAEAAECPLFLFVKEDEDLYPNLDYSPVAERTRRAVAAIARAKDRRNGKGLLFAPHITSAPHEILDHVHAVVDAGATALMFSETFATGAVRMVREATQSLPNPPALYGHNAGIGVKTRGIWREIIDLLARLDGIDFRQTAPIKAGMPFLRPYGAEWHASETALTGTIPGIRPTMAVRAGGLDQGNIGLNLADVEARGITESVLFLAGSAINSIKDASGRANPRLGAEAMVQAVEVHRSGALAGVDRDAYLPALRAEAGRANHTALCEALRQRYPDT